MVKGLLVLATMADACGYSANYDHCAITCSSGICPSGLTCIGSPGICRPPGETGACTGGPVDAGLTPDATGSSDAVDASTALDAATPVTVTLSETTDDIVAAGAAVFCNKAGTTTRDNQWYRVFNLADFNITTDFTITSVWFASDGVMSPNPVDIKIGAFTGSISVAAPLVETSVSPNNGATDAAITTTILAGDNRSFIVELSDSDTYNGSGNPIHVFHLGATGSSETADAYYGSGVCSTPAQAVTTRYLIDVKGTHF